MASVVDRGCTLREGSFTNSNDMGTMAVANNAKAPMTHEKDKPRSKEPLYSLEFMPRPTSSGKDVADRPLNRPTSASAPPPLFLLLLG